MRPYRSIVASGQSRKTLHLPGVADMALAEDENAFEQVADRIFVCYADAAVELDRLSSNEQAGLGLEGRRWGGPTRGMSPPLQLVTASAADLLRVTMRALIQSPTHAGRMKSAERWA